MRAGLARITLLTLLASGCAGSQPNPSQTAPQITVFSVSPAAVLYGVETELTFSFEFAAPPSPVASCEVDQGVGAVSSGARKVMTLTETKTFTLTCTNGAGTHSATTTVTTSPAPIPPVIATLSVSPSTVVRGVVTPLTWTYSFANTPVPEPTCTIDRGVGIVHSGDKSTGKLSADTVFTLTCTNAGGSDTASTSIVANPAPVAPLLNVFSAAPSSVTENAPTQVAWTFGFSNSPTPAPTCTIDSGIGTIASGARTTVTLAQRKTYTLTCTNTAGSDSRTFEIVTTPAPVAPDLATFSASPAVVTENTATTVTWTYAVANSPNPTPSCSITPGVGSVLSGSTSIIVQAAARTYTLTCSNSAGSDSATFEITTTPAAVGPILSGFSASPSVVTQNVATNVTWTFTFANSPTPTPSCSISPTVGNVVSGSTSSVLQALARTYTLTCSNSAGSDSSTFEITAVPAGVAPVLASFEASPTTVVADAATPITWTFGYSNTPDPTPTCTIDQGVGELVSGASTTVTQTSSRIYRLTCTNAAGSDSRTVTISIPSAGTLTCPPVVNADMTDCPSYLGSNVVSLCTCGTADQASLSCNPGAHIDRTYCWTAPSAGTYRFALTNSTAALGIFRADSACAELACDARGTNSEVTLSMQSGERVYMVLDETSGNTSFTLGISKQ